jgi:hypothetical protein
MNIKSAYHQDFHSSFIAYDVLAVPFIDFDYEESAAGVRFERRAESILHR